MSDIGSSAIASSSSSSTKRAANASTRRPCSPIRSFAASMPGARLVDRHLRAAQRAARRRAAREHDVGAALDELDHALGAVDGHAVERGHELVVGVERHLGEARVGAPGLLRVDAELGGEHDERGLGRVADHAPSSADRRVAVEHEAEREPREVGHRRAGDRP